ncbi:MAG: glycosyltransferase [Microbacteriaceae bacterium]
MNSLRRALVIVLTDVTNDPRVRRQIDWLSEEGFVVDSLGYGDKPGSGAGEHFAIKPDAPWTQRRFGHAFVHGFVPYRARFRLLAESHFPPAVSERIRTGGYELIIFNDTHLIPWVGNAAVFTSQARAAHMHLDLHEYFAPQLPGSSLWRKIMRGYYAWGRNFISHPAYDSHSVVAGGIGNLYVSEFAIAQPTVVRNCPPFVDQQPSAVSTDRIQLIHHGGAAWPRGLKQMVDAMRLVDDRFTLTFMLVGSQQVIRELKAYAQPLGERVRFVDAVPMVTLATEINAYDAEVMFFPPVTQNLRFALPNKLFESVQGRLATVIGPTPTMMEIVNEFELGPIATGWSPEELAVAINSLTADNVREYKAAAHKAADVLNATREKAAFLRSVGISG